MAWNWDRFLHPPVWGERRGREGFVTLALGGIALMVFALSGFYLEGLWAQSAGFLAGAGLTAGAGSTLALAYGEWTEETRFALKVTARVGFLVIAPCSVLVELPYLLEEMGSLGCIGLCAVTVIPFGLSLIRLIWKKRNA